MPDGSALRSPRAVYFDVLIADNRTANNGVRLCALARSTKQAAFQCSARAFAARFSSEERIKPFGHDRHNVAG